MGDGKASYFSQKSKAGDLLLSSFIIIMLDLPHISVTCYQGSVEMAMVWVPSPVRRQCRLPGCPQGEAELTQGLNKQQQVAQGTRTTCEE